jgi:hypothetical protein
MYLPNQSEPVQRVLAGQPLMHQSKDCAGPLSADHHGPDMRAGEYGVHASFSLGSIVPIISTLAGLLA